VLPEASFTVPQPPCPICGAPVVNLSFVAAQQLQPSVVLVVAFDIEVVVVVAPAPSAKTRSAEPYALLRRWASALG
jgi:hypothetical protein